VSEHLLPQGRFRPALGDARLAVSLLCARGCRGVLTTVCDPA
jgi:hypothetical protein